VKQTDVNARRGSEEKKQREWSTDGLFRPPIDGDRRVGFPDDFSGYIIAGRYLFLTRMLDGNMEQMCRRESK